uniref:GTP-binding protein n=1 Tax=Syphacia muris TaxID=451379 RepID=A0A0N5AED7_9BILA
MKKRWAVQMHWIESVEGSKKKSEKQKVLPSGLEHLPSSAPFGNRSTSFDIAQRHVCEVQNSLSTVRTTKYYRDRAQSNPSESKTKEFTLAVLGASRVGKSALVGQFLWDGFVQDYRPTIEEFNWIEYNNEHEKEFMLQVIDSSGSHDFLAMRQLYAKTADAFVVVYAVDDAISLDEAKGIVREIRELNAKRAPILMLANKIDLYDSPSEWVCKDGDYFATKNHIMFSPISAKNSQKVSHFAFYLVYSSCIFQVDEVFSSLLNRIDGFLSSQLTKRRQSMPSTRAYSGLDPLAIAKVAKKHQKNGCVIM